tara:strand:- start:178 stop:777 length:600 start_codon:yes stop_codon:yes gene_type:complete
MIQFKGFKPEAMQRIAGSLGYQGNMNGFNDYLNKNPDKMNAMNMYQDKAIQMANGGVVQNFDGGGVAGHPHPHAGTAILGEKGTVYNSRYDAAVNSNVGDTVIVDGITFVKSTGDGGSRTTGTYLQQVDTPAELSQALSNAGTGTTSTATFIPSGIKNSMLQVLQLQIIQVLLIQALQVYKLVQLQTFYHKIFLRRQWG